MMLTGVRAVDLLEPFQDRAEVVLVTAGDGHVVDGEDDDGLDTLLSDPLRSGQAW